MIGAADVDYMRRKSDTYKEYFSWAVPGGTYDASRVESNDGGATSSHDWLSENPGPE